VNGLLWRALFVAIALLLVGGPLALTFQGCQETVQAVDTGPPLPDAGASRACGDVGPYGWDPRAQQVAGINDAGESSTFFGVWGMSDKAVWAVGSGGTVIHYDGTQWIRQTTPTTVTLTGVWGVTEKDVWAVGLNGTVIHYDGTEWKDASPPILVFHTGDGGPPTGDAAAAITRNLWGVWATGKTSTEALYAVGDYGTVIYFDGKLKLWSDKIPITVPGDGGTKTVKVQDQLNGVWGASANRVYIVGNFGTVLEGNKTGLALQNTGITKDLHAVWGRSDGDVYAVGTNGTVLNRRSGSWTAIPGAPKQVLRGVWGPSNNSSVAYIVGWDGTLLKMAGSGKNRTFDPYYCIIPGRRLEAIWGTLVPITMFDAGTVAPVPVGDATVPPDLTAPTDSGIPMVPLVWVVGASGMVITGP
jgi:hypothetical protein